MRELTAPMGWNSWDCYGAAVNEEIVRQNAEFMAKNLKEYGWDGKEVVLKKSKKQIAKEKARNKVVLKVTGIDLNAKAEAKAQKKAEKKAAKSK